MLTTLGTEWLCELGNQLDLSSSLVNHVMLGEPPPDQKQQALALIADLRSKLETLSAHIDATYPRGPHPVGTTG